MDNQDKTIIVILGAVAVLGLIGFGALSLVAHGDPFSAEVFVAATSASVGALASRLNNQQHVPKHDMELLGTAVSSTMVAHMIKAMLDDDDSAA